MSPFEGRRPRAFVVPVTDTGPLLPSLLLWGQTVGSLLVTSVQCTLLTSVQCTLVTSVHTHLNFEISLAYKYISCCQWTKWIIIIFFPNIFSSSKNDWFLEIIGNYCSDALRFIRNDPHQSLSHVNILKFDQTSKNYTSNPTGFNVLLLPRIWHNCHINQKEINQNRHTKTKSTVSICVSAEL